MVVDIVVEVVVKEGRKPGVLTVLDEREVVSGVEGWAIEVEEEEVNGTGVVVLFAERLYTGEADETVRGEVEAADP